MVCVKKIFYLPPTSPHFGTDKDAHLPQPIGAGIQSESVKQHPPLAIEIFIAKAQGPGLLTML